MLKGLMHKNIFKLPYSVGVHVHIMPDGEKVIKAALIQNKGGKINLIKTFAHYNDLLNESKKFTSDYVYAVCITGKGIIEKSTNFYEDSGIINLNSIMPGVNEQSFDYNQLYTINQSELIVYLTRKVFVNEILKQLNNPEFVFTDFYLGEGVLQYLSLALGLNGDKNLILNNQQYLFSLNKLIKKEKASNENTNILFSNQPISEDYNAALAIALRYFIEPSETLSTTNQPTNENKQEQIKKSFFKKSLFISVISITILFFINFFISYLYTNKVNTCNDQLNQNAVVFNKLKQLKQEVNEKETFLEKNGLLNDSRLSLYADQIAAITPIEFILDQLSFNPIIKSNKIEEGLKFNSNHIRIQGRCNDTEKLSLWIEKLKDLKFNKKVSLENFVREKGESKGTFIIITQIRN